MVVPILFAGVTLSVEPPREPFSGFQPYIDYKLIKYEQIFVKYNKLTKKIPKRPNLCRTFPGMWFSRNQKNDVKRQGWGRGWFLIERFLDNSSFVIIFICEEASRHPGWLILSGGRFNLKLRLFFQICVSSLVPHDWVKRSALDPGVIYIPVAACQRQGIYNNTKWPSKGTSWLKQHRRLG